MTDVIKKPIASPASTPLKINSIAGFLSKNSVLDHPVLFFLHRLLRNPSALLALSVLLLFSLVAIFSPWISSYHPYDVNPADSLIPPSAKHWMGTDILGRDIFSRVIYGGRTSMLVGLVSISISAGAGVIMGLFAGFYGGFVDNVVMRIIDTLMAFPGILLALTIVALLGPGIGNVMIAVGISGIANYARLVRGSVLTLKEELYIEAARSTGANDLRLIFRHILPNAMPPILILASMSYGWALLSAASLSFLGLGASPPAAEWGAMLSDGRSLIWDAPWTAIFPGLAIMCVVLAANLLGDALRDISDPRLRI
jgi:peptide/nickel transport system permease protein